MSDCPALSYCPDLLRYQRRRSREVMVGDVGFGGDNPIRSIEVLDLRQSMRNGGGPACLRLRLVLNESERRALSGGVVMDEPLYARLVQWVQRHYRDRLSGADLADAALLRESREALDELTAILGIGAVYPFQLD